jgi:hypothetical protein
MGEVPGRDDLVWIVSRPHSVLAPLVDAFAGSHYPAALRPAGEGWWLLRAAGDHREIRSALDQLEGCDGLVLSGQHAGGGTLFVLAGGTTAECRFGTELCRPDHPMPAFSFREWGLRSVERQDSTRSGSQVLGRRHGGSFCARDRNRSS